MDTNTLRSLARNVTLAWVASVTAIASNVSAEDEQNPESSNGTAVAAVGAVVASLVVEGGADKATGGESGQVPSEDQLEKFFGEKAFLAVQALTDCDHSKAFTYAHEASAAHDPDQQLAGYWLEALTEADRRNWYEAKRYARQIGYKDKQIHSEQDFDAALKKALEEISAAREQYGPAPSCKR